MANYKCKGANADIWKDGLQMGGKIDHVVAGAKVTGTPMGSALYIHDGAKNGKQGYAKLHMFEPLPVAPPPPDDETDPEPPPPPPPSNSGQLWQLLRQREAGKPDPLGTANSKGTGTPDIIVLREEGVRVQFTRAWQSFLQAINPTMSAGHVAAIMGSGRWGFNGTGLPSVRFPARRANFLTGEDTDYPYPYTDKDRSMTYACHKGDVEGDEVVLQTLDGNKPPPDINLINPQRTPHLFFALTIVYPEEKSISWFPNSGIAWGYNKPYTWFPLVATTALRVPLRHVRKVSAWVSPYKG